MSISTLQRIGWFSITFLIGLFIYIGLINFIIYLLFVHLISDLISSLIQWRFSFISRRAALLYAYTFIIALTGFTIMYVIPQFKGDFPTYANSIERTINNELYPYFQQFGFELELDAVKQYVLNWLKQNFIQTVTLIQRVFTNFFLFILAVIINFIIQFGSYERPSSHSVENLLQYLADFTITKILSFYHYFKIVMSAQLLISLINSILTLCMLFILNIPHKLTLTVFVFIFGLLPIVGNIISNTLICSAALIWTGMWQFFAALIFLIVIHKLEYVLNGKIIGHIVQLPMHITLLALILGEAFFHIPGMILAVPMVLFIREQLSSIQLNFDKPSISRID